MTDSERLGEQVSWTPIGPPQRVILNGEFVRLEPLNAAIHGAQLYRASHGPGADDSLWDYLAYGPFDDEGSFLADMAQREVSRDPLYFAVIDKKTGVANGVASLMRIDAENGVGEVGHIWFGPALQRTAGATEAIFLLADYVMTTLAYRRFEWKCNALNTRSRRAAERFGFTYEGTFRQHSLAKGRNRDTAWYSIIDAEWPAIRAGFVAWLDPANFNDEGQQVTRLEELRG